MPATNHVTDISTSSSPDPLTTTGSHDYFNGGMFNRVIGSKAGKKIVFHRPVPSREDKVKTVRKSVARAVHIGRPVGKRRLAEREPKGQEESIDDI